MKQFSHLYSQPIFTPEKQFIWEIDTSPAFNELIISWSANRPINGAYQLSVSVNIDKWSEFLPYAQWSATEQKSYRCQNGFMACDQDTINICNDKKASGFRVKLSAIDGADLSHFETLYASASDLTQFSVDEPTNLSDVQISHPSPRSQRLIIHPRKMHLCSPTSASMAIDYLIKSRTNIAEFAEKVHDDEFDIYGNWVFNVAECNARIRPGFSAKVARLNHFSELHDFLTHNLPVVVSVKGPLTGAFSPYQNGHLMLVIGHQNGHVICIDPAGPTDENATTQYKIEDFLAAWGRRYNLSYIFGISGGLGNLNASRISK
jgi:hypothetical protein